MPGYVVVIPCNIANKNFTIVVSSRRMRWRVHFTGQKKTNTKIGFVFFRTPSNIPLLTLISLFDTKRHELMVNEPTLNAFSNRTVDLRVEKITSILVSLLHSG